ncbi:MAG: O-antigen ligase family protein [Phycisphaerae bacterium]|nr:O-antigen ligase family protein [Phycisphaerae bacterium]
MTQYGQLAYPAFGASELSASWSAPAELDDVARAPLLLVLFIGLFAGSSFALGDHPTLFRIPYYLGIASAVMVTIMYLRMQLSIPAPVFIYAAWVVWAAIGVFTAEFREMALLSMSTALQFLVLMALFATMCQDSRAMWIVGICIVLGSFANVVATWAGFTAIPKFSDRAAGLLRNPNSTALAYGIAVCICYGGLVATRSWIVRIITIGLIIGFMYGIVRTASRSGVLSVGLMTLYGLWHYRRRIVRRPSALILIAMTVIVSVIALPRVLSQTVLAERMTAAVGQIRGTAYRKEGSVEARVGLKFEALRVIMDHPVFGVGLTNFPVYTLRREGRDLSTHDNYLEILASTGLPGFAFFYAIYVWAWYWAGRLRKSELITDSERTLTSLIRMFVILLLSADIFSNTTWSNKAVWTLMALSAGLLQGLRTRITRRAAMVAVDETPETLPVPTRA